MNTTIAAISTAVSASGIGIIRISGPEAMDVISRIYRSKGGKKKRRQDCRTRRVYQESFPERQTGSFPGRGSYGCDPGEE